MTKLFVKQTRHSATAPSSELSRLLIQVHYQRQIVTVQVVEFQGQKFFLFLCTLYSTYHEGETFPRDRSCKVDQSRNLTVLLKNGEKHCRRVRDNSDFMILDTWM